MHDAASTPGQLKIPHCLALLATLLVLTACSLLNRDGNAPILGHNTPLQGEAVLVCSSQCAERGQCGDTREQETVILGGRENPSTITHDIFFPAGIYVTIDAPASLQALRPVTGGDSFSIFFYHVVAPGEQRGWVAGWCIQPPP